MHANACNYVKIREALNSSILSKIKVFVKKKISEHYKDLSKFLSICRFRSRQNQNIRSPLYIPPPKHYRL